MYNAKVCVVVDAFSTGSHLPAAFLSYGKQSVHVQSLLDKDVPSYFKTSLKKEQFLEHIVYDGNIESIVTQLKKYEVLCVVAGSEIGVELADAISEKFNLSTSNGTKLSSARRDKYQMVEALKDEKVDSVSHFKSSNIDEVLNWVRLGIQSKTLKYPVVLKPISSSGTDGFNICNNENEIISAFSQIMKSTNFINQSNTAVLVQNYLNGQEYNVNTVSCAGNHYVTEILRVDKNIIDGKYKMYDKTSFLSEDDPAYPILVAYTKTVLHALQISYGPAHCEIIIDQEQNKPILVELSARLMGAINPKFEKLVVGYSSVEITAEAYLAPTKFLERVNAPRLKLLQQGYMIDLWSWHVGTLEKINVDLLARLETHYSVTLRMQPGSKMKVTTDLFSSPGVVFLLGFDKDKLERDFQQIRLLEKNLKLYQLMSMQQQPGKDPKQNDSGWDKSLVTAAKYSALLAGFGLLVYKLCQQDNTTMVASDTELFSKSPPVAPQIP